jgi:hypothetical protein
VDSSIEFILHQLFADDVLNANFCKNYPELSASYWSGPTNYPFARSIGYGRAETAAGNVIQAGAEQE